MSSETARLIRDRQTSKYKERAFLSETGGGERKVADAITPSVL